MINTRAWIFAVAAMGALALMSFSPAQLQAQSPMSVDVPFDFYVGSQRLPAGKYAVKHMADPAVLHVSDGNGHASVTLSNGNYSRSATPTGRLIFTRYGDQYFLSEVHWADSTLFRQLMRSPLEIQIARSAAAERITASTNNR
jgi:hypothetical protein